MENLLIRNPIIEPLIFENWGLIDYDQATTRQLEYVERVATENLPGYLVFCSHPPVVTLGRSTKPNDVFSWQGPLIESSRGGRATYHGPSQIVIYPIVNLKFATPARKARDVVNHLRLLENALVKTLSFYGIFATGKSLIKNPQSQTEADETGVWVGEKKIASLGIAAKKWVTYHGAALNFSSDPNAFKGIKPCGFTQDTMISVEALSQKKLLRAEFENHLAKELLASL